MPKQLYILELEDNKYYVGTTDKDVQEEFIEQVSGSGADWTREYPPKKIIESYELKDDSEIDKKTLFYMASFGISNVRGGSFCDIDIDAKEETFIRKMIATNYSKCFKCNSAGHFAAECTYEKKEPITLPTMSFSNALIISAEVNLFDRLNLSVLKKCRHFDTVIFPNMTQLRRYLSGIQFVPISGLNQIQHLICTLYIQPTAPDQPIIYDFSYFVNLKSLYVLIDSHIINQFQQELNRYKQDKNTTIISQGKINMKTKINGNLTTIYCSTDPIKIQNDGRKPEPLGPMYNSTVIKTHSKINFHQLTADEYENLIKQAV